MKSSHQQYWRTNLLYLAVLLGIWFLVSYGFGILWKEELGIVGFWFAQQGAIYVFIVLIFVYVFLMNRLDKKHSVDEDSPDN